MALEKDTKIFKQLLDKGAEFKPEFLFTAISANRIDVIETYLETQASQADINIRGVYSSRTLLMEAALASNNQEDLLKTLLKFDWKFNFGKLNIDENNKTVFHHVLENTNSKTMLTSFFLLLPEKNSDIAAFLSNNKLGETLCNFAIALENTTSTHNDNRIQLISWLTAFIRIENCLKQAPTGQSGQFKSVSGELAAALRSLQNDLMGLKKNGSFPEPLKDKARENCLLLANSAKRDIDDVFKIAQACNQALDLRLNLQLSKTTSGPTPNTPSQPSGQYAGPNPTQSNQ